MATDGSNGEFVDDGSNFLGIVPTFISSDYFNYFHLYEKIELSGEKNRFRFRCLLKDTTSIPETTLVRILRSWDCLYIHKDEKDHYDQYLKRNLHVILVNQGIDMDKRSLLFTEISSEVIQGVMAENFKFPSLARGSLKNLKSLMLKAIAFLSKAESLKAFANLIGHDYESNAHCIRVGWLMAIFINANQELFNVAGTAEIERLVVEAIVTGFLHDIGKAKIPRQIIQKKGRLNNLEYAVVQAHSSYSLGLLFGLNLPGCVMEGALYHHENEDGSGYPFGLKGDAIPVFAKLCHIADVFDALALTPQYSTKNYRTPYQALTIMAGKNPDLDALRQMENEVWMDEPPEPLVLAEGENQDELDMELLAHELKRYRDFEKRVEARGRLRDKGMSHCFDAALLKRFVLTLNRRESFDFSNLFQRH